MRTLANWGRLVKGAPFSIVRGQRGKVFSFYLYLWSRVVWGGSGPCGLGLWASRMNFACTEFSEVRLLRGHAPRCGSWHHTHRWEGFDPLGS